MTDYSDLDVPECLLHCVCVSCGFDVQLISCAFGQPRVCVCVRTSTHRDLRVCSEMWENEGSFLLFTPLLSGRKSGF